MSISGIDIDRLRAWMDAQGLEHGPIADAVLLTGGTQNVLLRFRRGERTFVLRRPPVNPRPGNNATMLREARMLGALAGSDVPHPALIAACADPDVLGAAFYLMDNVAGFNATVALPRLHAGDPAVRHAMGLALVDGAAALGRVDHRAVGLADFGNADDYLARQVARWQGQLDGYGAIQDWPGREGLPAVDAVAAWLAQSVPPGFTPGVIHGDYSIGNVMYRNDGPGLAAIIDWELATIGDPLIDLGWIMATWPGAGGPELAVLRVDPWSGFPAIDEMVERYRTQTSRDTSRLDWYAVLACYKLAILLEGTFARACAGNAPMAVGERLHDTAVRLLRRAEYRIAAMPCAG